MKILHSPFNIGNQAAILSKAEKDCFKLMNSKDISLSVNFSPGGNYYLTDKQFSSNPYYQNNNLGKILNSIKIFLFGLANFWRFNVFHFYFGRTFFSFGVRFPLVNHLDLLFLKLIGKTVFMTYQGCDVRMRSLYCEYPISACKINECNHLWCSKWTDWIRRKNIELVSSFADKVFCLNPDLIPLVPKSEFLPYSTLLPEDMKKFSDRKKTSGKITIIHAPSNRDIKGTKYIESTVSLLKKKYPIEFILIENVRQEEVYAQYSSSDILIDQLLVGWYGSSAVEGMASGLSVISHIHQDFLKYIPKKMAEELPIISATPLDLYEKLEALIKDAELRKKLASKGRNYVNKWHNPGKIAEAMIKLYKAPTKKFIDLFAEE
jgi:hypothetical protein